MPTQRITLRCYTKQRQVRHCQWYNSALHVKDSGEITILSLVEDVTEQVGAAADAHRLAHFDTLTELPNRILLNDCLDQALASARLNRQSVSVMMVGLDRFKTINGSLGHKTGDALLPGVA